MVKIHNHFPLGFLLFPCFFSICLAIPTTNVTTDQYALLALRAHISLDPLQILTKNWSVNASVCHWIGVTCNSRHHRVSSLNISNMGFTGIIPPQLGNLSFLVSLDMIRNKFFGELPQELGQLRRLKVLKLGFNNLTGLIPKEIGNATMLRFLDISHNHMAGLIPGEISNLHNLEFLNLEFNTLIGSIPTKIFNLSSATKISFQENQLSGNLPTSFGHGLPNLEQLFLAQNNLTGPIPYSISNSSKLNMIELSYNKFTNSIPHSLGDLKYLEVLSLGNNNFMSDSSSSPELDIITSLTNCKSLNFLAINENPLNGILPDSVGNLSSSLENLYAYHCNIYGKIPDGIGNLTNLVTLSLRENQLIGSLPITIKRLQKLQGMDLSRNKLSEVTMDYLCSFQNLAGLNFLENLISGSIPECLGNVTSLRYLHLDFNRLNSSLPTNIWNLQDIASITISSNSLSGSIPPEIQNFQVASDIDLSMNQFTGGIPSTIGDMVKLKYLSLAQNRLKGSIPESIGKMLSLETLDLSHNSLSGKIPSSLEGLKYLAYFNVSFNNLSGEIPSEGPFTNFTDKYFISNEALCGVQRFHVPPCPSNSAHRLKIKRVRRIMFVLLGVITVAGVVCFGFVYLRYPRKKKVPIDQTLIVTPERISYYKLLQATDRYDERNLLGTGSFGSVYRGTLDDGRILAIKVFNLEQEGAFKSFDTECEVLRKLRHRNLTKVISSCSNPDFKALVLEYMPNGCLEKWLYSHNYFLNIMQRLDILIDVACALQYLHFENSTPVVHCDLKPSNVLLDQAMVAHVSDFGVARLLGHEDSITFTKTLATLCYLAPEYGLEGLVSTKCDVYSFGIMMMEVFTRMSPNNEMFGENLNMRSWVKDSMPNGLVHLIDTNFRASEDYPPEVLACISSIMEVALNCTEKSPRKRSNIQYAIVALKKIKLQLLPYFGV